MASEHSGTSVVTAGDDTSGVPSRAEAESSNPPPTDGNIGSETEASTATTAKPTTDGATTDVTNTKAPTVKDWVVYTPAIEEWGLREATIVIPGELSPKEKDFLARLLPKQLLAGGYVWTSGGQGMKDPPKDADPNENWAPWWWWEEQQRWVYPVPLENGTALFYRFLKVEGKWKWLCVGVYRPV